MSSVKRSTKDVRPTAKRRPLGPRLTAAEKSDAAERERIRRMSAVERALLALDLGERFRTFAKPRT